MTLFGILAGTFLAAGALLAAGVAIPYKIRISHRVGGSITHTDILELARTKDKDARRYRLATYGAVGASFGGLLLGIGEKLFA